MGGLKKQMLRRGKALRLLAAIGMAVVVGMTGGCADKNFSGNKAMVLAPADLSPQEEDLVRLLNMSGKAHIFQFTLADSQSQTVMRVYQLDGQGQWELMSEAMAQMNRESGRIAVCADELPGRFWASAYGDEGGDGFSIENSDTPADIGTKENNGGIAASFKESGSLSESDRPAARTAAFLQNSKEIIYGQEIPVVMQMLQWIDDSGAAAVAVSPGIEDYFSPKELPLDGSVKYYAVTVEFTID